MTHKNYCNTYRYFNAGNLKRCESSTVVRGLRLRILKNAMELKWSFSICMRQHEKFVFIFVWKLWVKKSFSVFTYKSLLEPINILPLGLPRSPKNKVEKRKRRKSRKKNMTKNFQVRNSWSDHTGREPCPIGNSIFRSSIIHEVACLSI
jgi:hypothetical protein